MPRQVFSVLASPERLVVTLSFFMEHVKTCNCNVWFVKYAWILNKRNKRTKMKIKSIQDLR